MDTTRQSKISRFIQKELSELLRRDTATTRGVIVTVTSVSVSPDLGLARVRLSFFPSERGEELLESIRQRASTLRYDLGQRMGHLRKLPELSFFLDDSLDYLERIDSLLKQ